MPGSYDETSESSSESTKPMTVSHPIFPNCPSCDSTELACIELVSTIVETDGEGGVHRFHNQGKLNEVRHLECYECGKVMIEGGKWVIDPDDGKPVVTDGSGYRTLDTFGNNE